MLILKVLSNCVKLSSLLSLSSEESVSNLHLATKEDLMKELERRLDEERDQQVEEEDADEEPGDR